MKMASTAVEASCSDVVGSEVEDKPFATMGGKAIYFSEDWDTGIGGGLWSTGDCMAKYFAKHTNAVRRNLKGLTRNKGAAQINAIELGSGNGYLSVCLSAVAGDLISELYVTDLADHLPLMTKTLEQNTHLVHVSSTQNKAKADMYIDGECTKTFVTEHKWGVAEGEDSIVGKFDFIFGSDLAYRDYLHAPLIISLERLSHENTVSLIGVTMADTKPIFFRSLTKAGFRYERLADYLLEPEFRGTTFGLFIIQRSKLKPINRCRSSICSKSVK